MPKKKEKKLYSYNEFVETFWNECWKCRGTGQIEIGCAMTKALMETCTRCFGTGLPPIRQRTK